MSSRRRKCSLVLAPAAERDLSGILQHTALTWGEAQIAVYRAKLARAFEAIQNNPAIGHRHADLPERLRVYVVGSHMVVYRIEDDGIGVVRVLHQRMNLSKHV